MLKERLHGIIDNATIPQSSPTPAYASPVGGKHSHTPTNNTSLSQPRLILEDQAQISISHSTVALNTLMLDYSEHLPSKLSIAK